MLEDLKKLKALEFRVFWLLKSFTLKGGTKHQFINHE